MGFFDNFFGSGESTSTPTRLDIYTPEQKALLEKLAKQFTTGLEGPQPAAPAMSVPTTGAEQNYLDWARSSALQNLSQGTVPYAVGDEYVNQFMSAYKPVWERARNEAMDLARAEYAGPTYWGTARAEGLSDIASKWGEDYAMKEAELRLQQDEARRAAIDKYQGYIMPAGEQLASAGTLERGIAQEKVMEDLNRFLMGESVSGAYNPAYNPNVQLAMQLLGYSPYTYGTETKEEGPGLGYGILTGAASGLGAAAGAKMF